MNEVVRPKEGARALCPSGRRGKTLKSTKRESHAAMHRVWNGGDILVRRREGHRRKRNKREVEKGAPS